MLFRSLETFKKIIAYQGANPDIVNDYSLFKQAENSYELKAQKDGYIEELDALKIARACKLLGAGRDKKTDSIDPSAGCILNKKTGDEIKSGETLLTLYYNDVKDEKLNEAIDCANKAIIISASKPYAKELIYAL